MEKETYNLRLIGSNDFSSCKIEVIDVGSRTQLDCYFQNYHFTAINEIPNCALNEIRLSLENLGFRLVCEGCRYDVSLMKGIDVGYVLELGKPSTKTVFYLDNTIFVDKIATLAEQDAYFDKWERSLGCTITDEKVDINDPLNTIGMWWSLANIDNWDIQMQEFKDGIAESVRKEMELIKQKVSETEYLFIKEKFETKLGVQL
jgi:hypothetical protein